MEKRAILAAILMVGLLFLYQAFFAPVPPPTPPTEPVTEPQPTAVPSVATQPPLPARVSRPEPAPQRRVEVETPLYSGAVASDGGRLLEWVLHYRGEKRLVLPGIVGPSGLTVRRAGAEDQVLNFRQLSATSISLGPYQALGQLRLAGEDGFGLAVSEELEFQADDYRVNVRIQVENRHDVPQAVELLLGWTTLEKWPEAQEERFQGQRPTRVTRLSNGQVQRDNLEEGEVLTDAGKWIAGKWIALESEYYIAALVPHWSQRLERVDTPKEAPNRLSPTPDFKVATSRGANGTVQIALKGSPPTLAPGEVWEGRAQIYVGPKEYERLRALGVGLERTVHFGNFLWIPYLPLGLIAVPLLWLMNFFYGLIPNYGVAIILLTVITKVLFYPLTLKSMTSMKKMQAIQPQVNALRAKYQKDPQQLQRETMALYKKHGVNPLGGCLPMLIQMPIFIALFWVFQLAVELQNAVFLCFGTLFGRALWICDLAEPDPTYVLPVLMGASMFIQQKMTPMVGDPRQAKIMLMMPVVFTFFFLNLASGLVLYWCVSNVLQILQQLYMNRPARATKALRQAG